MLGTTLTRVIPKDLFANNETTHISVIHRTISILLKARAYSNQSKQKHHKIIKNSKSECNLSATSISYNRIKIFEICI